MSTNTKQNKDESECKALSMTTTIEPRVPRLSFEDAWVHSTSPLDIDLNNSTSISLSPLIWSELKKIPSKMTVTNIGNTFNVEAEYSGRRPSLNGSVLRCPYEFSSFHFHWGTKHDNGSEHRIMGKCYPMEIHVVFYNISYSNTVEASNAEDGKLILTYMCKLDYSPNFILDNLTTNVDKINTPGESVEINSFALSSLFDNDLQKYLIYWSACEKNRQNKVLWIISSKEIAINETQLSRVRSLRGSDHNCILSNCRLAKLCGNKKVLSVTQSMYQEKIQLTKVKNNVAFPTPERLGMMSYIVKSSSSAKTIEKEPAMLAKNSKINIVEVEKKTFTFPVVPTIPVTEPIATTEKRVLKKNNLYEKSCDLEDQREEVEIVSQHFESIFDTKSKKNGVELTKDVVISSIDSLLIDLSNDVKVEPIMCKRQEVQKTHREGVRMNTTALRREHYIKNRLQKNIDNTNKN